MQYCDGWALLSLSSRTIVSSVVSFIAGCAPTGSGKSGAFILPLIALSRCSEEVYYGQNGSRGDGRANGEGKKKIGNAKSKPQNSSKNVSDSNPPNLQGHIRSILLAFTKQPRVAKSVIPRLC